MGFSHFPVSAALDPGGIALPGGEASRSSLNALHAKQSTARRVSEIGRIDPMLHEHDLRADTYRDTARELRCVAFKRAQFDLCRQAQLKALAEGFERFADRLQCTDEKIAAD
jgi:hypothetical protein